MDDPAMAAGAQVRSFSAEASSAAAARRFVREVLAPLGRRVDEEAAILLVSELMANAVRHAGSRDCDVKVKIGNDNVVVAVRDDDPALPVRRDPPAGALAGRGLAIVERCADQWGVAVDPGRGKCVWFRLGLASGRERR